MSSVLVNNQWYNSNGDIFRSLNPANQEVVWEGKAASKNDVERAVQAASSAFNSWSSLDITERQKYIEKYVDILSDNSLEYARVLSTENGKPLWEAKSEVASMVAKYTASVKAYGARTGTEVNLGPVSNMLTHRPIGVMAVFGPFNFPGHLPNGHIIPAILAGNTVVYKPSELTPLCGELMIKYWIEAGLPEGVLNLVQGGGEVGKALVASADINGVLFTGSYKTGKAIHQALAGRPEVLLALEMGGNNPLIIDNDINNLDAAVYNTIQSAFITSGQRCTCARRLYIPDTDQGNKYLDRLVQATRNISVSDGYHFHNLDPNSNSEAFMGPVVSLTSKNNILSFRDNLVKNYGADELVELKSFSDNSAMLSPGILAIPRLDSNSSLDQECFGPLLQVYRYESFNQAILAANNTTFGLSAGLFSDNRGNFDLFHKLIRAGIVNWNKPTTGAVGSLPFGGIGHSGNFRPSAFYAADYCAYPMASQFSESLILPEALTPGINL